MRLALIASLVVAAVAATRAGTQVRDAGVSPRATIAPAGTGVLSGVLTTGTSSPQPVRRATMRLSGGSLVSARLVGTDDEGRFVFDALPAGSYTLSATKPGYVDAFYGSTRPGKGPGVPIAVADGQRVDVALTIAAGAVITGAITDARGRAVPDMPIAIVAVGAPGARMTPLRGVTDDRGIYRLFGLAPGDYLVSALPRPGAADAGRSGGATIDVLATTDADVRSARVGGASGGASSQGRPVAYAPVFYPGTTDAASATAVTVAVGEERTGISFALQIVPTARIAGTLVGPDGQPVTSASVAIYPRRRDRPSPADTLMSSGALTLPRATVSASGFSIAGVAPGEYTIVATTASGGRRTAPAPASESTALWALSDLTVDGHDQTTLALQLAPGLKLSGTIAFERTSSLAPPSDVTATDLALHAAGSYIGFASTLRARVAADGTFTFTSIVPGIYTLSAAPPGAAVGGQWTLKSAMLNGRDLADSAFEVVAGHEVVGLAITFTDRAAAIAGRLVDAGGRPITRYSIVVFPADRALWLPSSRRIRSAQPATDGSFTVAGLPAGTYAIAAAEDVAATDLEDPAFLARLLASSRPVTIADGEQARQDLQVAQ